MFTYANGKASAKHAGVGEGGGWGEGDLRAKRARKRKPSCFPPTLPNRYRLTFYIFATATGGRVSFEFHQVALRYHWILHLFQLHFQLSMHCRWSREVWDHVQMYKFTQGRGALELYSVFFAACHAKHVNLHFPIYFI